MGSIKQYRTEWKYCCAEDDLRIIEQRLDAVLEQDRNGNGSYTIHSLYFDDYMDSCAKENEAGISRRYKYRIRYYGDQPGALKLECKKKIDGRCQKESCQISMEEYQFIINGKTNELMWRTDNALLQRFCMQCMTRYFMPRAIIDYKRTAYVEENTHVRITLDENIAVSEDLSRFLTGDYLCYPIQEKQWHVLEVKFDDILPGYLRHLITNRNMVQSSFSKYCMGQKILADKGRKNNEYF